ncbi:MAG TPA: hypothetical protein VLL28_10695 [Hyphomicrobiaceae bacterium]|nr:hypothetical protein [Hyphomicrobiaceae bacterium]
MTNPACAARAGKIAKTEALWRPSLQAAQPAVPCTGTPDGTQSPQAGMSALTCQTTWVTHVIPAGLGRTTGLRFESNGPALQFKPGGT